MLVVDRPDDLRERLEDVVFWSKALSHDGRSTEVSDRSDEDPDDVVWWLWRLW